MINLSDPSQNKQHVWIKNQKSGLPVNRDFSLLEVLSIILVQKYQVDPVFHAQSIVDIFVRRSKLDALHVHSDRNNFSFLRASVHHFVLDQCVSFSQYFSPCSEIFLPDQGDFHAFYLDLYEVKVNFSHNDIFQMVEGFIPNEFDVQTILNSHLHLHGDDLRFLNWIIGNYHCKINFFCYRHLNISCQCTA